MSRRAIIECDRCGAISSDEMQDRAAWGRVYAATVSGDDKIGTAEEAADLCGGCLADLTGFMANATISAADTTDLPPRGAQAALPLSPQPQGV